MSAPNSNGRMRYGVAIVLSTMSGSATPYLIRPFEFGADIEWTDEVRGRDRVVDDEWQRVVVSDLGDELDVEDVDLRVTDGLREQELGVGADGRGPLGCVVLVLDERDLDAQLRERVLEEVVCAAIDGRG